MGTFAVPRDVQWPEKRCEKDRTAVTHAKQTLLLLSPKLCGKPAGRTCERGENLVVSHYQSLRRRLRCHRASSVCDGSCVSVRAGARVAKRRYGLWSDRSGRLGMGLG